MEPSDLIYNVSWLEIASRLSPYDKPGTRIYGIPRGGLCAISFLRYAEKVQEPGQADLFVDDIIDSGRTRDQYQKQYPGIPFVGLFDKSQKRDKNKAWLVFPWESSKEDDGETHVTRILEMIGEDPQREGLQETPARVVKSWGALYQGYTQNPADIIKTFTEGACDEMVVLRNIEMYSMCEHHMLPFFGRAHIAYIPNKKVIGISKLARLLDLFSRRLQIQERIGDQITAALMEYLEPQGAACIIEAQHLCMLMRGVSKQNSVMVTSSLKGAFKDDPRARAELMNLCAMGSRGI